jgi:hypothetical protein
MFDWFPAVKSSQGTYQAQTDEELLIRAFGEDNVCSLNALRDRHHKR